MDPIIKLTGMIAEKDCNSVITKCNKAYLEYASVRSADKILGCTDYDLPWEEGANLYRGHELDTIKGNIYTVISPVKIKRGNILFLQTKTQKLDSNGLVCGVLSHSIEIIDPTVYSLIQALQKNSPFLGQYQPFYLGKKSNTNTIVLPRRQEEVLFYLIRGKSAKSIARLMGISFRTVEYYITILKDKFNCATKNELIESAINKGFSQYIPLQENFIMLIEKLKIA